MTYENAKKGGQRWMTKTRRGTKGEEKGETLCTRVGARATDIRAILQTATAHLPGFIRRLKFYSL